jgi:hypothetical protein
MQSLSLPYGRNIVGLVPNSAAVPTTPPRTSIDDLESALSQLMAVAIWGGELIFALAWRRIFINHRFEYCSKGWI